MNKEDSLIKIEALAQEVSEIFVQHSAYGGIVGLSGTDSLLTFIICAEGFKKIGKLDHLVGVHYGEQDSIFAKVGIPFLQKRYPEAALGTLPSKTDGAIWGDLIDQATMQFPSDFRPVEERLWVIGTKNRTEEILGTYSNSTKLASIEPIITLWKSEVLEICKALVVPDRIINLSYIADCACGNPDMDMIVGNPYHIDVILKKKVGELARDYDGGWDQVWEKELAQAVDRQIEAAAFKSQIPHRPRGDSVPVVINVNPQVIKTNTDNGTNDPPLRMRQGRDGAHPVHAYSLEIDGPCRIIHAPQEPIPCGARVWIETYSPVRYR